MGVFTERYIRPLFCEGVGPFRWLAISGDPEDIYAVDDIILEHFAGEPITHWITAAREAVQFTGLPARIGWLGYGDRRKLGLLVNDAVASGRISGPIAFTRDHLDSGSVAAPVRETERMLDGSDGIADWPILNALLNTASHADLVAVHGFGGQAQSAGATTIADGTAQAAERLSAVLTNDPGNRRPAPRRRRLRDRHRNRRDATDWGSDMAIAREDALGLDEVAEALDNGWTLPARWYSDPEVAELEHEKIFARSWTLLCPEAKLASPGDHVVGQSGRVPVVVTRDAEGQLHGFVNVCRHRAHPVAMKDGCRKLLQCRYHGWTYTLDGRLQNAPRMSREMDFDRETLARARSPSTPGAASCSSIPTPPRPACTTSTRRSSRSRSSATWASPTGSSATHWVYPIEANWKVFVENATECYHCPTVHTKSFSDAFITDANVYELRRDRRPAVPVHALQRASRQHPLGRPDGRRLPLHLPLADVVLGAGRPGRVHGHDRADRRRVVRVPRRRVLASGGRRDVRRRLDGDVRQDVRGGRRRRARPAGRPEVADDPLRPPAAEEREPDPALPPARATTLLGGS